MYQPTLSLTMTGAKTALAEGVRALESGESGFDLAAIAAVDSAAVAILLGWCRAAQARGVQIEFHHSPQALHSLAALYGVSELLQLHQDDHPQRH